jgi:hypothetical protein
MGVVILKLGKPNPLLPDETVLLERRRFRAVRWLRGSDPTLVNDYSIQKRLDQSFLVLKDIIQTIF